MKLLEWVHSQSLLSLFVGVLWVGLTIPKEALAKRLRKCHVRAEGWRAKSTTTSTNKGTTEITGKEAEARERLSPMASERYSSAVTWLPSL